MLVLSRRLDEKIILPTVPAIIKVISSHAGLVRLGFEAPPDVPIFREELAHKERGLSLAPVDDEDDSGAARQDLRHRLTRLTMHLTLLRMQMDESDPVVRKTFDDIEAELLGLRRAVRTSARDAVVV